MKRFLTAAVLVYWFIFCGAAGANSLTSLYGDRDGFGLGYGPGQVFHVNWEFYEALAGSANGDPAGTDMFGAGIQAREGHFAWRQWTMAVGPWGEADTVTALSLEMLTGAGFRFYQHSTLYFDTDPGEAEHWMAVGQFACPQWNDEHLKVREDVFDLMPLQDWILPCLRSGSVTFRVETRAGSGGFPYAGWMMDYSVLSISDREPPAQIPESPTAALLCAGLVALLIFRNRHPRASGGGCR